MAEERAIGSLERESVSFVGEFQPIIVCSFASLSNAVLHGDSGGDGDRTGLMVWAGARALCAFVLANKTTLFDKATIIELGIGSGMTTALMGRYASRVIGSDGSTDALRLARETIRANRVEDTVNLVKFDWHTDDIMEVFDIHSIGVGKLVLVAAEIVYPSTSAASLSALFAGVAQVLASADKDACFIMSYVQRNPETTLSMLSTAFAHKLSWEKVDWHTYTHEAPALDACVLVFKQGAVEGPGFDALLRSSFPSLLEEIDRKRAALREAEEEAESFQLPGPLD